MSVRGFTASLAAVRLVCVVSINVRINKRASPGRCVNSYHDDKSWIPRLAQIVLLGETRCASGYQSFAKSHLGLTPRTPRVKQRPGWLSITRLAP